MVLAVPAAAALLAAALLPCRVLGAPRGAGPEELQLLREDDDGGPGWLKARAEIAAILRRQRLHRGRGRRSRGRAARGHRRGAVSPRRQRLSSLDFRHSSAHVTRHAADPPSAPASAEAEPAGAGGAEAQQDPSSAAVSFQGTAGEGRGVDPITGEPCDPGSAGVDDEWSSPDAREDGDAAKQPDVADVFGDTHPAVGRQLEQAAGPISALRGQQEEAEHMRQRFGHVQREAQAHMDDALEMQRTIEGLKAEHQRQSRRIAEIGATKAKLEERHRALLVRVQEVMEPRLDAAQTRLENRKTGLKKAVQLVEERNIEREKERVALLEALAAEKEAKIVLHKAEEVAKEADRKRADAAEQLRSSQRGMGAKETALRYSRSRYEASLTEQRTSEDSVTKATGSITRLQQVLSLERQKLEEAFAHSQAGLQGQIKEAEAERKKCGARLEEQERRYAAWQLAQQKRMEEAAADKAQYDSQQRAYLDKRSEILRDAQARAGAPYAGATSRDDWAWPGAGGGAAVGREVHLTEPLPEAFTQPESSSQPESS